jgi:hypothetical protein
MLGRGGAQRVKQRESSGKQGERMVACDFEPLSTATGMALRAARSSPCGEAIARLRNVAKCATLWREKKRCSRVILRTDDAPKRGTEM